MSAIGTMAEGDIIQLNENGTPVDFYIAKHDYESGLNGTGRTLVVRKDCYDLRKWDDSNINAYASSAIDDWLNGTYKALLDADVQAAIGSTKFYYTPGNGDAAVNTVQRAVFLLSAAECEQTASYANAEGTALPIASDLQIAKLKGSATKQWTRSPSTGNAYAVCFLSAIGRISNGYCTEVCGSRPAFTLPSTFDPNPVEETITISGADADLGEKSESFSVSYTVTTGSGTAAAVTEKLDSTVLRTITVQSGAAQTVTVDPTALTAGLHTVQITASVSGLTAVRTYTFTVPGPAPEETVTISGSSGDLGNKSAPFEIAYSVATGSGDPASVTETLDGAAMRTYTAASGAVQSVSIDPSAMSEGAHTFSIQAEAGGVTATRTNAFTVLHENTPPDDYYQSRYSGEEIDNGVGRALPGGALDESIAKVQQSVFDHMVGANLLDNWYYPAPINQRGQTEYSGAGYGIDRWKIYQSQVSLVVQPNGIAIRRSSGDFFAILQYVEDYVKISGKTVTFSMLIKAAPATYRLRIMTGSTVIAQTDMQSAGTVGVISLTAAIPVDLTDLWVTIYISPTPSTDYFLLEGAKLEIGTRQTLAHQDESGNWVLNDPPPNMATELAKCQRYQIELTQGKSLGDVGVGQAYSTTDATVLVPLPTTLRTMPVISYSGTWVLAHGSEVGTASIPITSIQPNSITANGLKVLVKVSGGLSPGEPVAIHYRSTGKFLIDSNL